MTPPLLSPYKNSTLSHLTKPIRLIKLRSTEADTQYITLELSSHALYHCPGYTALSYTWGDPNTTRDVLMQDCMIPVTENLWEFLSEMMRQREQRYFWIDALCINQADMVEKSSQVQMMSEIYKAATHVIAWLGTWDKPPHLVTDFFHKIPEYLDIAGRTEDPAQLPELSQELGKDVRDICTRPYWRRLWTVQERAFAQDIEIACGPMRLSWTSFAKMHPHSQDMIATENRSHQFFYTRIGGTPGMDAINKKRTWSNTTNLVSLIMQYRKMQCSDPRDKVFALLSMQSKAEKPSAAVYPDYTKSTLEVYSDVLSYAYPSGAHSKGIDPEFVAGILPSVLKLDPKDPELQKMIKLYLPEPLSESWQRAIALHFP